ncbi:hypothetical protein SSX86_017642 [Deinandra increscens subsp. villosa]|uniref:TIR domain-containing protein n=1 Tax=Deinandra increscens subsp. villosa TaxID=3103831 RepID=A0AAP0D0A6_9ASTR
MASSSQLNYDYDVFLSFRGEDTRKTFVDYLYSTLEDQTIHTYKDDITLARGESITPSLKKAIEGSRIAVVVFSENYADSSWCLEELAHIMKCRVDRKLIVMPLFSCVDPSDVRKQKGKFGEAFAKHEDINKVEYWREALIGASEIAGWQFENIANGHEMQAIKKIVSTILDKLLYLTSDVDEDFVGMGVRVQEVQAKLEMESGGVRMVGIWGGGGSGKSTIAHSLCKKLSHNFKGHCFLENIREQSLHNLQATIISTFLKEATKLKSVAVGKDIIKTRLKHRNVLIILDDVDHIDQLDALAGSPDWFGSGSRIIITTRNKQLLISHKVDHICSVTLLSREEANQLFSNRAYNEKNPVKDYKALSRSVVSYAAGLPLALKVLGSFLYAQDEEGWRSTLKRLKDNPEMEIVEKLKISYDGLKPLEKQIFLDIACFFRWKRRLDVMEILEACGYNPGIGVAVLKQKALITIRVNRDGSDCFDMHDLVQEMGHYIVKRDHPSNPEKHSRVWEVENLVYLEGATMENDNSIEAIQINHHYTSRGVFKMISSMKKLRLLIVTCNGINSYRTIYDDHSEGPDFLSNELRYIDYSSFHLRSPFPDSFKAMKLVGLRLASSQKELWKGYKHLPHLKLLQLVSMKNLLNTPNFDGLPCLQTLKLESCNELTEIHSSLGNHTNLEDITVAYCSKLRMFPTISKMRKLKALEITYCHETLEFPEIKSNMESLVKLTLIRIGINALLSSIGERCANLISLQLIYCYYLKINKVINFHGLKHLDEFILDNLHYMNSDHHPVLLGHWRGIQVSILLRSLLPQLKVSLQKLVLNDCHLKDGETPSDIGELSCLRELDLGGNYFKRLQFNLSQLTRLKFLNLSYCKSLVEFPKLPSRLAILLADGCGELKAIAGTHKSCKRLCQISLQWGTIINDGSRLLESMLQGHAIENRNMLLEIGGVEIANGFRPPLVQGNRCRLQLPENCYNEFSGFLMCVVLRPGTYIDDLKMEHIMSGMESEDDGLNWEEDHRHSDCHGSKTVVWYVPFASLRHTTWWDETYNAASFSLNWISNYNYEREFSSGFGVRLVPWKSGSGSTAQEESEFFQYAPKFTIKYDSANALSFRLEGDRSTMRL